MIRSGRVICLLLAFLATGCAGGAANSPSPSPGPPLTTAELRYRLIDTLGPLWYCDRDFYPVARDDEAKLAIEHFAELQADRESFTAILAHLGIAAGVDPSPDQKLAIYRAWKQLQAIQLSPVGQPGYQFDYLNMPPPGATDGRRTAGTIDDRGVITVTQQAPAGEPPCPICLARGTRIATPSGAVAVEDLTVGMTVISVDDAGRRVVAHVVRVGQTRVPATHEVVRLELDDGRIVRASPGHPLVDGSLMADLRPGDMVDGAAVVSATLEAYEGGSTFDLLTDSRTGAYIADGIPLGSTLVPHRRHGED